MSYKNRQSNNNNHFSVTSKQDGSRSFKGGDHDDRFYSAPHHQNQNQRGRGNRGRGRNRRSGFKNFNHSSSRFRYRQDDDDDEVMEDGPRGRGSSRINRSSRGRGMRRGGGRVGGQMRGNPEHQWYKILVPFGSRIGKDGLFKLISDNADIRIDFQNYHTIEQRAFFFVQGTSFADCLRMLSRRITGPDGQKIVLIVSESGPPKNMNVSDDQKEKLKVCMSNRYEASVQLLNLSSLYADENLKKEGAFLPLNKTSVMEAVTKIISEHIPEMTSIDLSQNKLMYLRSLSGLIKAAPGVTSLNLGKNQLNHLDELDKLKGWTNLLELVLDGNELCNSFSNETEYISAVRKKFPKVIKLDGKELPPPITFDLESMPLPASQGSYFLNDDVKTLLVTFVKEYYSIFDSDNRKSLLAAYHSNAQFSYQVGRNQTLDRQGDISNFVRESRNLKRIGHIDSDKLSRKIKVGSVGVIAALEEFPKTTHDLNTFTVDVMLASATMLTFVLHGVFKETASKADKPIIRSFSRTFVTTPAGGGVSIINDMLTISNAGVEQARNAFKEGAPTPSSSPASSSQQSVAVTNPATQKQMIESFMTQSGMNADFSMKCLQENSWDYQRAAQNFQELKEQGKIPPDAFVK